jgi:hypothetical protein
MSSKALENVIKLNSFTNIFDFMSGAQIADVQAGTLSVDVTNAFNSAITASKNIYFPPSKYRFDSTVTINGARGLILRGAACALENSGTGYPQTTELYFNNAPSGSSGLVLVDFLGVTISDMSIIMLRGGVGGGYALQMHTGHDYALENIKIDTNVNASGGGIKLGNGSSATSTFVGNLRNVKCIINGGRGAGILWDNGTSLTAQSCYIIGGYFEAISVYYSSLISCAVDSADASGAYAYKINGCSNMGFFACGAEQANKGAFFVSNSSTNIVLDAPYGAANNTSADATIGDLVQIDSSANACNSITINNPTSVAVNGATAHNIFANAGTGFVEVLNTDLTLFPQGVGGDATWKKEKLTITGWWDQFVAWTPVLVDWTNVGAPSIVGKYKRVGKIVTFYVSITPGTSISSTLPTSRITGLPFAQLDAGSATMVDNNAVSYGACTLSPGGVIFPQTSGVLTVGLNFVGTAILQ